MKPNFDNKCLSMVCVQMQATYRHTYKLGGLISEIKFYKYIKENYKQGCVRGPHMHVHWSMALSAKRNCGPGKGYNSWKTLVSLQNVTILYINIKYPHSIISVSYMVLIFPAIILKNGIIQYQVLCE